MIVIDDVEQNSPEWFALRLGNPGASNIDKIITPKGDVSKSRDDYMMTLAGELVCGKQEESYKSIAMMNGNEREESARQLFELAYGVEVKKVGLVYKDEKKLFHCSPDGLFLDSGLEIKCPMMKTHVRYLLENKLPSDYFGQVQMSMYVCESDDWYFMSYYEGLPPLILNVKRDEKYIEKLEPVLLNFCCDLGNMVEKLRKIAS
ncbi:MAG: YqaJ viral recombinase family protein [Porphyromonadaceae bacterium]|nr:YqaJ viral recombinase family protein [Porphyromonadaceae bacterium]